MGNHNKRTDRIGTEVINKYNETAICVEYINANQIYCKFKDVDRVFITSWKDFQRGNFKHPDRYKNLREGQYVVNPKGSGATCISYVDSEHIIIQFDNSDITLKTKWGCFKKGKFKSPFDKNKFGGYLGMLNIVDSNGKNPPEYELWMSMLKRCYSESIKRNRPTYDEVTCCEEWMCFKNFKEWLVGQPNYEKWKNDTKNWCLDKDILAEQNHYKKRIYSSDTCCLVPSSVNSLFVKVDALRGEYPIGVYFSKKEAKFKAQCQNPFTKKYINLGRYDTPEEAFFVYKSYKEKMIKQVAKHEYSLNNITKSCYEAMMNYEVLITD